MDLVKHLKYPAFVCGDFIALWDGTGRDERIEPEDLLLNIKSRASLYTSHLVSLFYLFILFLNFIAHLPFRVVLKHKLVPRAFLIFSLHKY